MVIVSHIKQLHALTPLTTLYMGGNFPAGIEDISVHIYLIVGDNL
jgi:hypothetical protein